MSYCTTIGRFTSLITTENIDIALSKSGFFCACDNVSTYLELQVISSKAVDEAPRCPTYLRMVHHVHYCM
jgi:hypothetical protein